MIFQLQYKTQSKTFTSNLDVANYQNARDFFENLIVGELYEIREFVHIDNTIKKDDGNYKGYAKVRLSLGNNYNYSLKVPKLKKTTLLTQSLVENSLRINGKKPTRVDISFHR